MLAGPAPILVSIFYPIFFSGNQFGIERAELEFNSGEKVCANLLLTTQDFIFIEPKTGVEVGVEVVSKSSVSRVRQTDFCSQAR